MVLLIGNYPADRQQSMLRFAAMMRQGLAAAGVAAELIQPQPVFGRARFCGRFVTKWLAYIDKFILFPRALRRKLAQKPDLVHICDHSNAMYAAAFPGVPIVITCHDLLAVRAAHGEATGHPASVTGKLLQRWIVAGLRKATALVCDSVATMEDAQRLIPRENGRPTSAVITLGLNYPFHLLSPEEARRRLSGASGFEVETPFVLHVGSNLIYKNRAGVLRIFARCREQWNGRLVFAGEALSPSLRTLAGELGIADRIVELPDVSDELLEALYNRATALLFPSSREGFGWPIAEAQACGCPVICADHAPMAEVAGPAALMRPLDDEVGMAADLLRLTKPTEREHWSAKSLENAQRFSASRMISEYCQVYRSLASI
ncbi:MAG TPA: glycosyltransferase family 1 protein [Chthoniobacterales bacterium]|nr:glycosyltransferase family 1 protein [Chthoniobacterales bacterium]